MPSESADLPTREPPSLEDYPVAFSAKIIENIIASHINVPLSEGQLETAEITAKYIEPVIFEVEQNYLNESIIYDLLASYYYFSTSSEVGSPSNRRLMETRMQVALKIARHVVHDFDADALSRALLYDFYPLNRGSQQALTVPKYLRVSALELAVKSEAKQFLMEPPVFSVVNDLWDGLLVVDQRPDANQPPWMHRSITNLHRVKNAKSPRFRHIVQLISAAIFLVLYLLLIQQDPRSPNPVIEGLFVLWSCGYALDEYNQLTEFGKKMYFMSLWNSIDTILVLHCLLYGTVRLVSLVLPQTFPRSFMVARGILITAGLFVVPRLFSVFDSNRVFSNMVFSLQKVSTDFLISWFVVMMFSVGVWVSVAFSIPRVRISSDRYILQSDEDNGGARTALAMFKMAFDDASELWDRWFEYTTFDKIALCFYLILAQFVMPTVVTAAVANSFANIRENSQEEFYYMRAAQSLQKIQSRRRQRASAEEVSPLNFIAWVFEWLEYILPQRAYRLISTPARAVSAAPGEAAARLTAVYLLRVKNRARNLEQSKKERLLREVDRSLGESDPAHERRRIRNRERREAKFGLVSEVFTNKKIALALQEHPEWHLDTDAAASNREENEQLKERLAKIEAAMARIESKLDKL